MHLTWLAVHWNMPPLTNDVPFTLVPVPDSLVDTGKSLPTVDSSLRGNDGQVKRVSGIRHIQVETVLDVSLNKKVNLFIGPNASGKSTILRAIRDACSVTFRHNETDGDLLLSSLVVGLSDDWSADWPRDSDGDLTNEETQLDRTVPVLYIPVIRFSLPVKHLFGPTPTDEDDWPLTPNKSLSDYEFSYYGVFYSEFVESTISFLREERNFNRSQQNQLRRALEIGYSCAKSICTEVIQDEVPHTYVDVDVDHDISDTGRVVSYGMGIGTSDNVLGEPLYAGVLSSGTQGTLLWIYALALKIAHHYDWQEGWEKRPAILLIDEIENHLHPTWQRRVIPALLEHFPGLQIFATTHSPFVVAGLKAGQVHLLKRDENGVVTATTNEQDIIGWTMDEILRTMMGVPDPTDEDTAKAARELRELRNAGPAATEAEEQKRQERIRELRQKVDRDLLAGGPMAARREEFKKNLAEILERHRREQSLNQENG